MVSSVFVKDRHTPKYRKNMGGTTFEKWWRKWKKSDLQHRNEKGQKYMVERPLRWASVFPPFPAKKSDQTGKTSGKKNVSVTQSYNDKLNGRGRKLVSWPRGVIAKGIPIYFPLLLLFLKRDTQPDLFFIFLTFSIVTSHNFPIPPFSFQSLVESQRRNSRFIPGVTIPRLPREIKVNSLPLARAMWWILHLRYGGNRTRAEPTSKSHKVFDLNHSADRVYTIGTEGSHHIFEIRRESNPRGANLQISQGLRP